MLSIFVYLIPPSIFRPVAAVTLGFLVVLVLTSAPWAKGLGCEDLVSSKKPPPLSPHRVKTLQKDLETLGYNPDGVDGIIGAQTRGALAQFCKDFGLKREFTGPLSHYAQIAVAHQDWKDISLSAQFEYWINNQVVLQGDQMDKLRRSGTARQIIDLLNQYKAFRKEQARYAPPKASDGFVSYVLTPKDFEKLKSEDDMIDQLEKHSDQTFATEKDLLAVVEPIIEEGTDAVNVVMDSVLKAAQKPAVFVLTDGSFEKLKSQKLPDDLLKNLRAMKDVPYPSEEALKEEVDNRIKAYVAQLTGKYTSIVAFYADERTTYQFNADSIAKIQAEDLPADLVAQIIQLKGVEYPSQEALDKSVKDTINQVNAAYRGYIPTVLHHARIVLVYRLSEKSFEKLKSEKVPAEIVSQLQPLMNTAYFSRKKLQKAVGAALDNLALTYWRFKDCIIKTVEKEDVYQLDADSYKFLKGQNIPDSIFEKILSLKGHPYKSKDDLKDDVAAQIHAATVADYRQYPEMIEKTSEQTGVYELNAQIFKNLRSGLAYKKFVPAGVIDMVSSLAGNEYPRAGLFLQALQFAVRQKVDKYREDILAAVDDLAIASLNDQTFNALKDGLREKAIPEGVLEHLGGLKGQHFPSKELFRMAVSARVDGLYEQFRKSQDLQDLLLQMAEKTHRLGDARPPAWFSDSCDCGPRYAKEVYGFYPFWGAGPAVPPPDPSGEKTPVEGVPPKGAPIDFSGLSRIGYFALPFDEEGRFPEKLPWDGDRQKDKDNFVIQAHRFKSKVDLVIYSNHWADWVTAAVAGGFQDKAVDDLSDAMARLAFAPFKRSFKNVLAHNTVDGLTLNFDGFPKDPEYAPVFVQILGRLSEKLKKKDEKYALNIVLARSDLGEGIFSYENLGHLLADPHGDEPGAQDIVNFLLVYLEEPTTLTKKNLRGLIEDHFKGQQRRNLLRKIVPVVNSGIKTDGQVQQFKDDLIYLEDNFAGVGLWPLLHSDEPHFTKMNSLLKETFRKKDDPVSYSPDVLNDICPYRWPLYLIWDVLVGLWVLYAVLAYWIFALRALLVKYWPIFLILGVGTILLTLGLLFFSRSPPNLQLRVLQVLGTIAVIYLGFQGYNKIRHKDYP